MTLTNGDVRIFIDNSTTNVNFTEIDVPRPVAQLYNDPAVRQAVRDMLRPLEREGINVFETRQHGQVVERVDKSDLPAFEPELTEREVARGERESVLQIVKPAFDEKLKWTVSDGTSNFYADIADDEFFGRVQRREVVFGKGDLLRVRLFVQTYVNENGNLTNRYTILEVVEVIQPPKQIPLL